MAQSNRFVPLLGAALVLAACTNGPRGNAPDAGAAALVIARLDSVSVTWNPSDRTLRAWSPQGAAMWKVVLPGDDTLVARPCTAPDSSLYARGHNALYAVSPAGALTWTHRLADIELDDLVKAPAPMTNSGVVFAATPTTLVALAPDGVEMWKYLLPKGEVVRSPPTVGPNGLITLVTSASVVQIAGDGVQVWQKPLGDGAKAQ